MVRSQPCNKSNGNVQWVSNGWVRPDGSHAEKAEKEASVRLWVHTAQEIINENLQISIGEDGVEITVTDLTDMPDLLDWAMPDLLDRRCDHVLIFPRSYGDLIDSGSGRAASSMESGSSGMSVRFVTLISTPSAQIWIWRFSFRVAWAVCDPHFPLGLLRMRVAWQCSG